MEEKLRSKVRSAVVRVISARFPRFNLIAGYLPLVVGIFIVVLHISSGTTVTYTPEGFIDISWNPLGEFLHFSLVVTGVSLIAYAFFSQIKTVGFRGRIIFISIGAILAGIAAPLAYSARSLLIFHAFNLTAIAGMVMVLIGVLIRPNKSNPSNP